MQLCGDEGAGIVSPFPLLFMSGLGSGQAVSRFSCCGPEQGQALIYSVFSIGGFFGLTAASQA